MRILPPLSLTALFVLLLLNTACEAPGTEQVDAASDPDQAAFVTRLGNDTLVVEQFKKTDAGFEATIVTRVPQTTIRRYAVSLDDQGLLERFEATVHDPAAPADADPQRRDVAYPDGDSLRLETYEGTESRTRAIAATSAVLPFIDMVHWPYELALKRAYASGADSVTQMLFAGRGAMPFIIRRASDSEMSIQHPSRGTMQVQVDSEGRLMHLDAGATTRKLQVERVASINLDELAQTFAARDVAGQSFRALSGRGEANATVHGATIKVDYGTPSKRGREIFGGIVAWDKRWRTGANRATHFETDRDLVMGDLEIPAGQYTLYTIPQPDGGTLMISKQTGQGGTTYNEDQDLGRVTMTIAELGESVEVFTILVEEDGDGGVLKLQWDQTEFSVPFTVKG